MYGGKVCFFVKIFLVGRFFFKGNERDDIFFIYVFCKCDFDCVRYLCCYRG